MSDAWARVREAITAGDQAVVADRVMALDEAGRREVALELPGHIRVARKLEEEHARHRGGWSDGHKWMQSMRVAGAGVLGGAAAVATWLYRRDFTFWRPPRTGPLLRVIATRPPEWQADLAVRLTLRLRGGRAQTRDDSVPLALELLRRSGAVPPEHDPLVAAWVSSRPDLEHDPLAEHLVPRIFEAEGVGRALREDTVEPPSWDPSRSSLLRALRDAVAAGRFEREQLIDGCVRRFLRGGSGPDLRFFARLHELLDPAPSEARSRDYLRLLPAAPGPVAELALRQLRAADGLSGTGGPRGAGGLSGAAGLSGDEVAEAVAALLFRAESKLVRAGLTLLDRAARDSGGDLDHLAPALASAFLCESYEVRERTVRLAVKHAGRFTPAGAEAVREAASVLPTDLAARLSEAYGQVEAAPAASDDFRPTALPAFDVPAREPFPPTLTDLTATYGTFGDGITFECWLDGFVRNPSKWPRPGRGTIYERRHWTNLEDWTEALLREAAHPGEEPPIPEPERAPTYAHHVIGVRTAEGEFEAGFGRLPWQHHVSPPHWALLLRCAEIHAALKARTLPPYLLATPTLTSGHLDPAELVARLEGYEQAGVQAMPADLGQALLRLPREVDPKVIDRAGGLTSEAGATLTRWLKDRPEPSMCVDWSHGNSHYTHDRQKGEHTPRLHPRIRMEPTGLPLVDALLSDPPTSRDEEHGRHMSSWRLLLPSDREAVAMHLLPHLLYSWDWPSYFNEIVAALFHQDGPVGEGTALLVAVLLSEHGVFGWPERGQQLLLRAAAAGCLPAAECGRQLGLCLRRDVTKLSHVRSSLEACARQGAHREVWEIMAGLLAVYLPRPDERPHSGHTQALAFAAETARWAGARGAVPAVAESAARKGSSGFVRAAGLLHEQLLGDRG